MENVFLRQDAQKTPTHIKHMFAIRNVWRYQRGNQNPKKDRKQNGQKKKDKKTNKDPQNNQQKTKNQVTRTPLTDVPER